SEVFQETPVIASLFRNLRGFFRITSVTNQSCKVNLTTLPLFKLMTTYKFYTCDVFTDTRFGGNPLAVLPDATGLTTAEMQLIAREFNFSESTFVFPSETHTRQVRIFTPSTELPFAGHPNIGTAFTLASIGEFGLIGEQTNIVFDEKAGLVPITIRQSGKNPIWCELRAPQTLAIGQSVPTELIAKLLSLPETAVITKTHQPQEASVGLPFVMVELENQAALEKVQINTQTLDELKEKSPRLAFHLYTFTDNAFDIRTRMFSLSRGLVEDPATGSANCALAAMLTHYQPEADGEFAWKIAQGFEMGRPSTLDARTVKKDGNVTAVYIAGECVMITEGEITV
ncbi:MAG: PhzF family phenazine biosynthesis protein, partial [Chloroflexota bacterium]